MASLLHNRRLATWAPELLVVLLGVGLRLLYVADEHYRPVFDAASYLHLAAEVARYGTYHTAFGAGGMRGPSAYFAPGYPYLLSLVMLLHSGGRHNPGVIHLARIFDVGLGTITVLLILLLGRRLGGRRAGLAAGLIAAVYPVFLELSSVLAVENLLTPLLLGAVLLALAGGSGRRPRVCLVGAGLLLGLAVLTHADAALVAIPLTLGAAQQAARASRRRIIALVPAVVGALVTVPWLIRDRLVMHRFVPITDEGGLTLAGTYNAKSAAAAIPYSWHYAAAVPALRPLMHHARHFTETGLSSRLTSAAFHYIGAHPFSPLLVLYDNTRRMLELEGSYAWRHSARAIGLHPGEAHVGVIAFWILAALALLGLLSRRARAVPLWIWLVPVLLWLATGLVNAEMPRFREPIDPFLILLAGCGLAAASERIIRPRARPVPASGEGAVGGGLTGEQRRIAVGQGGEE